MSGRTNPIGPLLRVDGRLCTGVLAIAFATLVFEISLIRLFSFTVWHHFAYLILSVALLGTGAAGTLLSRYRRLLELDIGRLLVNLTLGTAVAGIMVFVLITLIPFNPLNMGDPIQWFWLTAYYLLAFIPFLLAGLCLALVFAAAPMHIGRLYFWDLLGAGLGSLAPLGLIGLIGVPGTIALAVVLFIVASLVLDTTGAYRGAPRVAIGVATVLLAVTAAAFLPVRPSPAKALRVYQDRENATILSTEWHPVARVDAVEYPLKDEMADSQTMTPLWYGVELLADRRIVYDGDASPSIIRFDGDIESLAPIEKLLQQTPYLVTPPNPSVLIIGLGGGFDVLVAVRNKARRIVGVELHPLAVELVRDTFADYAGHLYQRPEVEVHAAEGRAFVSRTKESFDLIQMTSVDSLTARRLGAYILAENYLFTVEAIEDFLDALSPDGIFSIIDNGGPDALREAGLIVTALHKRGITEPEKHMILTSRGVGFLRLVNTLVRLRPFSPEEVTRVKAFAEERGNLIFHLPGGRIEKSVLSWFVRMTPEEREVFFDQNELELRPTTDDSPFFHSFHKWSSVLGAIGSNLRVRESAYGQLVLIGILAQTIIFSILFILVPLRRLEVPAGTRFARLSVLLYFTSLGVGFMLLEISMIQRFVLFLGHPAYAISTVLAGLLVAAGLGSYMTHRSTRSELAQLGLSVALLIVISLLYSAFLPWVFQTFLYATTPIRFLIGLGLIAPLGLVLGRFLPIGIRIVAVRAPALIPWAWGINACTSTVSTVLAVIIAMEIGFRSVGFTALGIYLIGAAALGWFARTNKGGEALES